MGQAWGLDTRAQFWPSGCEVSLLHPDGTVHLESTQEGHGRLGAESQARFSDAC